jgi:hypothetical protein
MKKGFLAGFLLCLAVVLLPVFYYMDARSSSGRSSLAESTFAPLPPPASGLSGATSPSLPVKTMDPPPTDTAPVPLNPPESPDEVKAKEIVMLKNPLPVSPQKRMVPSAPDGGIQTRTYDPDRIYTLKTAVSHVTLIDLPEEAKEVYMGDSKLYLAEVFGKRVKVKPITYNPDARTNMIIYTLHKRITFRIVMTTPGDEDDLITFRSPHAETVVNLNPLKTAIRESVEAHESQKIRQDRLKALAGAGPTDPLLIKGEGSETSFRFLGFIRSDHSHRSFGLLEAVNRGQTPYRVRRIRIRRYHTSVLWEGEKQWDPMADWDQTFDREIPPGKNARFLVPVSHVPQTDSRNGVEIELDGQRGSGSPEDIIGDSGEGAH